MSEGPPLNLDAEEIDGLVRELYGDERCEALEVGELGCLLLGFRLALRYAAQGVATGPAAASTDLGGS